MAFCRTFLAIFFLIQVCFSNGVPQTIQYQGRFLDAATNRPVAGVVTKQIVFNIRKVEAGNVPGQIIDTHTASNVSVRDGVFNVEIPISDNVKFDEPYGIEVIVQGSGGGNVGFQPFRSVPYAITAKNALFLGGLSANQYALTTHIHTNAGQKKFMIDGTGANLLSDDAQFTIINGAGQEVFRVSASGDLQRVNRIVASGAIETEGALRVVNEQQDDVFIADQNGNVAISGDLTISGVSSVGSLEVSGDAIMNQITISESLTLGPNVIINATTGDDGINLIGKSHTLEDHASSNLFSKLISLTDGSVVTASLHSHSIGNAELTSNSIADNAVLGIHIKDGEITNDDIAINAAIDDSKLATISTAGKITTEALPAEVAIKNQDNTFGAGFDPSSISTLRTLNTFDSVRSKTFNVISTSASSGANFVEIKDLNARFRWLLDSNGTLKFSRVGEEHPRIEIIEDVNKTIIKLNQVQFDGDPSMISGNVIADGGIGSDDIADDAVDSTKLQNLSVTTGKIRDNTITSAKIGDGQITAEKIGDGEITNDKIANGAITADKIANNAITADKVANNAIITDKIADGAITAVKISPGQISTDKIADGAITGDKIANGIVTSFKIANGSISNLNLSSDVLVDREQPISIDLTSTITNAPNITLKASGQNTKFINMETSSNPDDFAPGVLISSSNQLVSLNLDGSISMKSSNFTTPVTLKAELIAAMMGITNGSGLCPLDGKGQYYLINPENDAENSGTGFCFSEQTGSENYSTALKNCYDDQARLCSVNEIFQSCKAGRVSVPLLSADLTYNTTISYIQFTGQNNCGSVNDVTYTEQPIETQTSRYACCVNP